MQQPVSNWMLINLHSTRESGMLGEKLGRLKAPEEGKAGGRGDRRAEGEECARGWGHSWSLPLLPTAAQADPQGVASGCF